MVRATRDRHVLPTLVAAAVAAFLVVPMLAGVPMEMAQSQEQEPDDPCENPPRSSFADRDRADAVHRPSIDCVDHTDISNGSAGGRLFRPLQRVTRGQMATFIVNTLVAAGLDDRLPNGDPPDEFNDIADDTHRTAINQLARIKVVRGTSGGRYEPLEDVRRDQMASFLLQALEWAYDEDYNSSNSYFGDVPPSNRHHGTINAAYEQGLVRGTQQPDAGTPNSGTYTPGRSVLRQAMASFLTNELRATVGAAEDEDECPSPSASPSPTRTASPTASPSRTASPTPRATPSRTTSPSPTASPTPLISLPPILGGSPSASPSPTPTPTPTRTTSTSQEMALALQQQTASPSPDATGTATARPTTSPSGSPCPSGSPTPDPSPTATGSATASPSPRPTSSATASPTASP